jgi:transcriptional regulator with XRE-family HTH domain
MATPSTGDDSSRFVGLIEEYRQAHGVSYAELARRIQITRQNLTLWRETGLRALPTQANLRSVAATIGRPHRQVLDAALRDTGYLTDTDIPSPRPHDEVLADAIRILTEAARLTNTPMRQTSSGTWEPNPTGIPQPIDWAEFVTLALAGAAANIGSIHRILAGRPGSWEAARVRRVLESTVGVDEESLWEHRTERVQVHLHVENILRDTGDESLNEYEAAESELIDRREATYQAALDNNADDAAADRILEDFDAVLERLLEQQRDEWDRYAAALTAAITDRLRDLNLSVPIDVRVIPDYDSATLIGETPTHDGIYERHPITDAVADAIMLTPTPAALPGTPLQRVDAPRGSG